jgi:Methyltransferase domain
VGSPGHLLGPELPSIHRTRAKIIEPVVRAALAEAGPAARALDRACNEGWFAHRLLEWGASEVIAVDVRAENIHRAALVRDHFGLAAERLGLLEGDVYDLGPDALGRFEVLLCLGLIYHLENPIGALRIARSPTAGTCVVETQTTRQEEPIVTTWGKTDQTMALEASRAAYAEPAAEQDATTLASVGPGGQPRAEPGGIPPGDAGRGLRRCPRAAGEPGPQPAVRLGRSNRGGGLRRAPSGDGAHARQLSGGRRRCGELEGRVAHATAAGRADAHREHAARRP